MRRNNPLIKPQLQAIKTALEQYQTQFIIQHCRACLRPCCRLTDVVLEFDWQHLRRLYRIDIDRKTFDRMLKGGTAPDYIRKQGNRYFTHGAPCPAYDHEARTCRHYHSRLKPENCSDFPLYLDGETIVADTRCEALDAKHLYENLAREFVQMSFSLQPDRDYPVLVYMAFRRRKKTA